MIAQRCQSSSRACTGRRLERLSRRYEWQLGFIEQVGGIGMVTGVPTVGILTLRGYADGNACPRATTKRAWLTSGLGQAGARREGRASVAAQSGSDRSFSSSSCFGSIGEGAPIMRSRAGLRLREGHHLANVVDLGIEGGPPVETDRDPAVRRGTVLQRVEEGAELVAHALDGVAHEPERLLEQLAPVDADRSPADSQPFSARSYCCARTAPGSDSRSGRSSGTGALNGLWVASQRWPASSQVNIGKRCTQT